MLAASPQERNLPFVPTLLCLWGAGWVTTIVTSFVFLGRAYSTNSSPTLMVGLNLFLSAAIGAVVVRHLLLSVVDCDISYSATLVALVAGSTAATIVRLAVYSELSHGSSPAVMPAAGLAFSVVPAMVGALVSFWFLQDAARSQPGFKASSPSTIAVAEALEPQAERAAADPHAGDRVAGTYSELVAAARESALGLVATVDSAAPGSVPTVISDGLVAVEVATKRLEEAQLPGAVSTDLNQRLVAGLKQLEEDLILTSQEAATTATDRMYERGLLTPSLADGSDGGARYRWELDQSEGLRAVHQALSDLQVLGFGATW